MISARIKAIVRQFAQNGMKFLLENPGNVRELLAVGEVALLDQIDFDHLTSLRASFVQRDYRNVEADVVLSAPLLDLAGQPEMQTVTIYILIEHQSEPDPAMAFRVLEYVIQIYKAQARDWGRRHRSLAGLRLHPVLPVVLYTGTRHWEGMGRLEDLVDRGGEFRPVIPAFDPMFLNLSVIPAAKLEAAGGFGWVLRLVQQRHARRAEFQELLRNAIERLESLPASERLRLS
jgi:predicted transposase YdaD